LLRKTATPAIITENFFFNNERETLEFLLSKNGRLKIIDYHVSSIVRVLVEVYGETLDFRNQDMLQF